MEKATIYMTTSTGEKIPVEVKLNKNLKKNKTNKKEKKKNNSKLRKALATAGVVIMLGTGAVLSGCEIFNTNKQNNEDISNSQTKEDPTEAKDIVVASVDTKDEISTDSSKETTVVSEGLGFNPNSKQSVIENSVFLIEEAARCGKTLDAEDAVLAVIAANSNNLTLGFMGELFGESAEQTYTYNMITDAYLKTCLIQLETVGVTNTDDIAFNMEYIFASNEDYNYLKNLRSLIYQFNNSVDENEKQQVITKLNELALNLTTYDNLDITSPAGVLAMLSLDGMRVVTMPMGTPILPDDIRDEMFGNEGYSCDEGKVLLTAYSNRVSDLKLDNLKAKLSGAVLDEGKTPILNDIIAEVKEQTKDVQIADFDAATEINKILNSYVKEEAVVAPVVKPSNRSENQNATSKNETSVGTTTPSAKEETTVTPEVPEPTPQPDAPVITPTVKNPEVTTPTEPELKVEDGVTPEDKDDVIDTGDADKNKEEAESQVQDAWEKAQADSNKGSADGMSYGLAGAPKPSFAGKSEYYINAFNASYEVYYQIYLEAKAQEEQFASEAAAATVEADVVEATTVTYDLDNLSTEQLNALKDAALGTTGNTNEDNKSYTK